MPTKRGCYPYVTESEVPTKRGKCDIHDSRSDNKNGALQQCQLQEPSTGVDSQERIHPESDTVQSDAVLSGASDLSNSVVTSSLGLLVVAPKFKVLHDSWEAFEEALKAYGKATYQLYVIRSTTSVKRRNFKIAERGTREKVAATCVQPEAELGVSVDQDVSGVGGTHVVEKTLIPERFLWYSKSLKCTHGWKDRHRGTGKRGSGVVWSTSCPAKMCVTLQYRGPGPDDWKVVVTKHMRTHNHQLSKELYLYYTENRRIYDPELLAVVGRASGATKSSFDMANAHNASLIEQANQRPGLYRVLMSNAEQRQQHAPSMTFVASDASAPLFLFPDEHTSDSAANKQHMALSDTGAVDQSCVQMRTSSAAMTALGAMVLTPGTVPSIAIGGGGFCVPRVSVKVHTSWDAFHDFIAKYSFDTAQVFRTRSTVSVAARNARIVSSSAAKLGRDDHDVASYASYASMSPSLRLIPEEYKWFSKLLICTYGWKRKARDKGSRADESNDAGPCPAMLLARMERNVDGDWYIVINRQVQKHNHRLSGFIESTTTSSGVPVQCVETDVTESLATASLMSPSSDQRSSRSNSSPLLQTEATTELDVDNLPPRPLNHREIVVRVPKLQSVFNSWDDFHASLKAYSDATYQLYRTRTTSSATGRNKKIAQANHGDEDDAKGKKSNKKGGDSEVTLNRDIIARMIPESWRWYSKTLTCTHGWKERHRGTGKRSAHGVRSTACPVKICATVQYMNPPERVHAENSSDAVDGNGLVTSDNYWRVVVTKHVVDHNHNLSPELYQHYCENRRIYDPELLAIDTSNIGIEVGSTVYQDAVTTASDTLKLRIIGDRICCQPHACSTEGDVRPAEAVNHAQVCGPFVGNHAVNTGAGEAVTVPPSVREMLYSVDAGQHFVGSGGLLPYSSTTIYLSVQAQGQENQHGGRQEHALTVFGGNTDGGPAGRRYTGDESTGLTNMATQGTKSLDYGMLNAAEAVMTGAMSLSGSNVTPIASCTLGSLSSTDLELGQTSGKITSEPDEVESVTTPASQQTCFQVASGNTYATTTHCSELLAPTETCFDAENEALMYAGEMEGVWQPSSHVEIVKVALQNGETTWRVPRIVQRYPSWEAFHSYLDAYSAATFQLYRVRTTYSVRSRNTRLRQLAASRGLLVRDGDNEKDSASSAESEQAGGHGLSRAHLVPERFEWYSKTFLCTHGWKRRGRGSGQRRSHNVRAAACPVKVCATLQRTDGSSTWNVVVTKHWTEHNHDLSEALYLQYSDVRRVRDPEVLEQAEQLWRGGATRRRVFELLKERSPNQVIIMKDVHNLVQRWQSQERRVGKEADGRDCNDQASTTSRVESLYRT
uniref:FAR1 domain-containing protein n=1 Tax=Peronospora matthiolae TaxID=2874970 RepID=A0AAV1TMJ4_9STRA